MRLQIACGRELRWQLPHHTSVPSSQAGLYTAFGTLLHSSVAEFVQVFVWVPSEG